MAMAWPPEKNANNRHGLLNPLIIFHGFFGNFSSPFFWWFHVRNEIVGMTHGDVKAQDHAIYYLIFCGERSAWLVGKLIRTRAS
jgi:hypothetical protein